MILLGRKVEEVSGKPLSDFLRERVFEPLKMKDTGYEPDPKRCAPTSKAEPGRVHDPLARDCATKEHRAGNAGLFSTGDDLAKFCQALLSGKVLKPKTVQTMFESNADSRGLGWDVFTDPPWKGGVGHTGYTGTLIWIDPAKGRWVVLLTNRCYPDDKASAKRLRDEVLKIVNR